MASSPPDSSLTDRTAGVASKYAMRRPARLRITPGLLLRHLGLLAKMFWHLTRQTLWPFEPSPTPRMPLTREQPLGSISAEMLQVCQYVADVVKTRIDKLESKANGLLALIAVVLPLTVSAAVFLRSNPLPGWLATATFTMQCLALLCFLAALIAALRALAVRGSQELFLNAVIDPEKDQVRQHNPDFFGRGLLYCTAWAQAMCDHIADFVRAAQVFLVAGVGLASIAAAPALFFAHEVPQRVEGTIAIHPESLASIAESVQARVADATARITRLESELESLRDDEHAKQLKAEVDELRMELAEIGKRNKTKN